MNPCDTCAYTAGSEANREPQNNLRAQFCVLGGLPFYCHHGVDGQIRDVGEMPRTAQRVAVQTGYMVICQGWRREVAQLAATGYYREALEVKRGFAIFGLGALQRFVNTEEGAEKRRAAGHLRDVIIALNEARGYTVIAAEEG